MYDIWQPAQYCQNGQFTLPVIRNWFEFRGASDMGRMIISRKIGDMNFRENQSAQWIYP